MYSEQRRLVRIGALTDLFVQAEGREREAVPNQKLTIVYLDCAGPDVYFSVGDCPSRQNVKLGCSAAKQRAAGKLLPGTQRSA